MGMKFCPNYGCVAYGRVVYTQATRCVFCRWDLKPPRMKSETAEAAAEGEGPWMAPAAESRLRAHHRRRAHMRPSA